MNPRTLVLPWAHDKGPQRTDPEKLTSPNIPTRQFWCRRKVLIRFSRSFPGLIIIQEERVRKSRGAS